MRKIIVLEHISLDGVIQAPGGPNEDPSNGFIHGGWIANYSDPILGAALREKMTSSFDLLLGRKTYEIWAPYWPYHTDIWPNADKATKYIASNTLKSAEWKPSVILHGDIANQVASIKQQEGPDIHVWGSGNLLQTLIHHDLVDGFWLMIYPITLGSGKRLFADGTIPSAFTVNKGEVTPSGVIVVDYQHSGAVKTGQL